MSEIQKLDYNALKPKILIILGLLVDSTTLPSQPQTRSLVTATPP